MLNKLSNGLNRLKFWKGKAGKLPRESVDMVFQFKYSSFKELLKSNADLLTIISSFEDKLQGWDVFGMSFIRRQSVLSVFQAHRMVKRFNDLSNGAHPRLLEILNEINLRIKEEIENRSEAPAEEFILPLSAVDRSMVDWVGEKGANLGEVLNRVQLPVPNGFSISTKAFYTLLRHNDLVGEIESKKAGMDPKDMDSLNAICSEIQEMIQSAPIPEELEMSIRNAYAALVETDPGMKVAMRSSALKEDSDFSFAGQYNTTLNVPAEEVVQEYKSIVASLYTPRAVYYRLNKGIRDDDIAMSVVCLQMVESVASGVMYTRHPTDLIKENVILISAVWGLGLYAVDGTVSPDTYLVEKGDPPKIVNIDAAEKPIRLTGRLEGGLIEEAVPEDHRYTPCLSQEQIQTLSEYGQKLEAHYGAAQDIEWALDPKGRLNILQTRPLHLVDSGMKEAIPEVAGYPILIKQGAVACAGIGFGPAFVVETDEDLKSFPEGAILVAKHSSPQFVSVMPKARGIVTDFGSPTGHMASLTREFGVPSVLDTHHATQVIPNGKEITVDAYSGRVYDGEVPELIALKESKSPQMKGTPIYETLRRIADLIVPLNLIDPKSKDFTPQACRTIHDIMRFVHELSYRYMFEISDHVSKSGWSAMKLHCPVNLDLFIIDVGGGVRDVPEDAKSVSFSKVTSVPFLALLKGLSDAMFRGMEPRPISLDGFMSVMRAQMLTPQRTDRFGERSYAIISDKYVNFSSRVGYHYSVVDSYCGQSVSKNYITFSFKGGAAGDERRNRRARAIGEILKRFDFSVDAVMDRVDGRLQKLERELLEDRLEMIGRLLQFTRQLDMLMDDESAIERTVTCFCKGDLTHCAAG